ncbi:peptidylprolyl isomerase [bacterium BMS3Bbin03]|nr:peptidylprolyl isomerase [bacterium BMS3Bbin03]
MRRFWVILTILLLGTAFAAGCSKKQSQRNPDKVREYANALYNQQLYPQAIQEYQHYLNTYSLSQGEQANITYTIANIYFDRLHDYQNALANYLKIKQFYPESNLQKEVNKKIVASLERLRRSADAQQVLNETTSLNPVKHKKRPGAVVAKIGNREITQGDLDYEISQLPPSVQTQFKDKAKKLEFLKQYVATELMYNTAKRKGLDKDKDVVEATFQAQKNFMVQKLLQQEIARNVKVDNSDIELYYKANKDKYAEKNKKGKVIRIKPFNEVKSQVTQDFLAEKRRTAYQDLINRMTKAENVVIYSDKVQ